MAKKKAKKKALKKKVVKKKTTKKKVNKAVTGKELKQHVSKIKKLLQQRDCKFIGNGIKLARSLDNPAIFEGLLKDCSIDKEGKLVTNKIFTGTGPAQPYLNYALLGMTAYAPKACASCSDPAAVHHPPSDGAALCGGAIGGVQKPQIARFGRQRFYPERRWPGQL